MVETRVMLYRLVGLLALVALGKFAVVYLAERGVWLGRPLASDVAGAFTLAGMVGFFVVLLVGADLVSR